MTSLSLVEAARAPKTGRSVRLECRPVPFVSEATIKAEVEKQINSLERFLRNGPAENSDWEASDWRNARSHLEKLTLAATVAFGQRAPLKLASVLELLAETAPLAGISRKELAESGIPWMLDSARRLRGGEPPHG